MPLPRKEVAIELLNQYEKLRQKDQKPGASNSLFGSLASSVATAGKYVSGQSSDSQIRSQIQTFVRQIDQLSSFENYIQLIYDLGNAAYKAECEKIGLFKKVGITDSSSLFCNFLHAIRSYLVTHISQADSPFKQDFDRLRTRLVGERDTFQDEIDDKRYRLHTDVTEQVKARDLRITKLAYLEEPRSIGLFIDKNLQPELPRYLGKPHNMITVLQNDYFRVFFKNYLQHKVIHISFEEFCDKAIQAHSAAPKQTAPAQASSSSSTAHADAPPADMPPADAAPDASPAPETNSGSPSLRSSM